MCFLVGCSLSLIPTVRLAFWPATKNWKRLFRLAILCGVGAYNTVTTVYTFRKMKLMFRTAPLDANPTSRKGHVDQYFLKLQNDWKIGVNKG
uniref:Secreted protein n=1 Tax=Bursaphelenchus xylophilus TaxID=6326 RepID=A0A1I7RXE3_BURXY